MFSRIQIDVKTNHSWLLKLIARRRHHDLLDAGPLSAAKCVEMFYSFNFRAYMIFRQGLIEMNVNITYEFHFSDIYRSVNYTG